MDEEEIDDLVGNVTYSDSQKSIPVEMYPCDVTEGSGDKFNSSGRGTYILEIDDSDESESIGNIKDITISLPNLQIIENNTSFTSPCSQERLLGHAQESFTQTSKTIIQVAKAELMNSGSIACSETQTSFFCFRENKTIERTINCKCMYSTGTNNVNFSNLFTNFMKNSLEDVSNLSEVKTENDGTYVVSEMGTEFTKQTFQVSEISAFDTKDDEIKLTDEQRKYFETHEPDVDCRISYTIGDSNKSEVKEQNVSEMANSYQSIEEKSDSDFEEDSLMNNDLDYLYDTVTDTSEVPQSVDNDVNELYSKLVDRINFGNEPLDEREKNDNGMLSPLAEESVPKLSIPQQDDTSLISAKSLANDKPNFIFLSDSKSIQIKLSPEERYTTKTKEPLKLPPITNKTSGTNFLKNLQTVKLPISKTLPQAYQFKLQKESLDNLSWKVRSSNFAAGESYQCDKTLDSDRKSENNFRYLPPIQTIVGHARTISSARECSHKSGVSSEYRLKSPIPDTSRLPISIQEKIRQLKMSRTWKPLSPLPHPSPGRMRGSTTTSMRSTGDAEAVTERACDVLCLEMLKHLRSNNWYEVADALDDLPNTMNKFWIYMSEHKIAELIRQICALTESPRTQVAKSACAALAELLKNTKYTKKPDFYEAITILLQKTGSYSRLVRRSANLALDKIVSNVDLSHAISALCIHGVEHKSPLVRSAAARLLVVCAALSGGGRELLRTRPLGAATARRYALRALSLLLDDKSVEARKYAERLYSMLRPLAHFEAYYLTDVNVELASAQMKKYDNLLMNEKQDGEDW